MYIYISTYIHMYVCNMYVCNMMYGPSTAAYDITREAHTTWPLLLERPSPVRIPSLEPKAASGDGGGPSGRGLPMLPRLLLSLLR